MKGGLHPRDEPTVNDGKEMEDDAIYGRPEFGSIDSQLGISRIEMNFDEDDDDEDDK